MKKQLKLISFVKTVSFIITLFHINFHAQHPFIGHAELSRISITFKTTENSISRISLASKIPYVSLFGSACQNIFAGIEALTFIQATGKINDASGEYAITSGKEKQVLACLLKTDQPVFLAKKRVVE